MPLTARGSTDLLAASSILFGDLDEVRPSPACGRDPGIAVALGAEFRDENLDFRPDEAFRSGEGAGQGGATRPVSGGSSVAELFLETNIPLVEAHGRLPRSGSLDLGLRLLRLRVRRERGELRTSKRLGDQPGLSSCAAASSGRLRAPNVRELFQPEGFNLFDMSRDPCAGAVEGGLDGVTSAGRSVRGVRTQRGERAAMGQHPRLAGQPVQLPAGRQHRPEAGILRYLDHWHRVLPASHRRTKPSRSTTTSIEVEKGISNLTPEFVLTECLDGDLVLCERVRRGATGDLWVGSDVESSGHIVSKAGEPGDREGGGL